MCLGQHLGRLEFQLAIDGLMRRFPNLHLAVPPEEIRILTIEMGGASTAMSVEQLPVAW
jgi:cytochrome P450